MSGYYFKIKDTNYYFRIEDNEDKENISVQKFISKLSFI